MNWIHVLFMTVACFLVIVFWNRTVKNRRAMTAIFFVLPTCGSVTAFAFWRWAWVEMGAALVCAFILYILWQGFIGHRLPEPSDDNIKVWGQE